MGRKPRPRSARPAAAAAAVILAVSAVLLTGPVPGARTPAAAQPTTTVPGPPAPGGPPGAAPGQGGPGGPGQGGQGQGGQGQGPGGQGAPNDSAEFDAAARRGAVVVTTEAAIIDSLGGFGPTVPAELRVLLDRLAPLDLAAGDDAAKLARLDTLGTEGEQIKTVLLTSTAPPSPETATVLSRLTDADRAALEAGRPISVGAATYLSAISDLATRKGRPLVNGTATPDGNVLANVLEPLITTMGGAGTGSTPTTRRDAAATQSVPVTTAGTAANGGTSTALLLAILAALLLLAILGVAVVMRNRGSRSDASHMGDLLEVSRRLTAAQGTEDVHRAVVREAIGLAGGGDGAIVTVHDGALRVGYESQPELLLADRLADGVLARVADTGQSVFQVAATEPSLRHLPAALAVVPIVGGGHVEAILVVVRSGDEPFTDRDSRQLNALAPVTAAALQNARHRDELAEAGLRDPLTDTGNRRRLDAELPELLADTESGAALVMIDLDHFKRINDTHGHPVGDTLLRQVASVVREACRPTDRVYRYGGEEFCVVLPDTDQHLAAEVADRMCRAIRDHDFDLGLDAPVRVTASMGVALHASVDEGEESDPDRLRPASIEPGARALAATQLLERADQALYRAKDEGRDRVVMAEPAT